MTSHLSVAAGESSAALLLALFALAVVLGAVVRVNRRLRLWKELRERAVYHIDNLFARGPGAQFLLLGLLTLLVVGVGMSAVWFGLFSPANRDVEGIPRDVDSGFIDSLLWSLAHILDPSWFNSDYGATLPVLMIALAVSLMGLVIFGIFIGFISAAVEGRVESLKEGNSTVKESGHVLILGWSKKVFFILRQLHDYNPKLKVVILSDCSIEEMREALRIAVPPEVRKRAVLRAGARTELGELQRVAFERAYAIIILADDSPGDSHVDIAVIKTMMLLSEYSNWHGARPKMVAEITRGENLDVALIAGQQRIPVILSSEIISRIMVESVRQPGLSAVYSEIFSFHGNEIYIVNVPECAGRRFDSLSFHFPGAIPMGVSGAREQEGRVSYIPELNPVSNRKVAPSEWLILLARDRNIRFDPHAPESRPRYQPTPRGTRSALKRVLILGWNHHLYPMLREFDAILDKGAEVVVAAAHDAETAGRLIEENLRGKLRYLKLVYRQGNYLLRAILLQLLKDSFDSIVLLADASAEEDDVDARTIMTMLLVRDLQQREGLCATSRVVAEITSIENRGLLESETVSDIVVSTEIVSMMLTQISQQQMLKSLYTDLLDPRGNEIYLKPVQRYVPLFDSVYFADVQASANQLGEVALGLMIASDHGRTEHFDLYLNPDQRRSWELHDGDKAVVLGSDLYD